jgi:putative ATPase
MEPLAIKLRPKKLSDVIGQTHLIGKDKVLSNLVKNNKLFSMILYGKPGIGKTTIATAITEELGLKYRMLNAVINNKKDFDIVVEEAKMYGELVVIMDEIHRLNKDKQDLLLPYLENGLIILIGMTTSNPYHSINPAIRSRCQIFELKELTSDDIIIALNRATKELKDIKIDEDCINYIANISSGDLRYAYNLLEVAYYSTDKNITLDSLKNISNKPNFFHDKNGDGYYDVISAFQKSIRGSDVDAALHYLARLIEAEDLDIIFRRMSVIAYEDIGLANPNIAVKVEACISACERLGLPEARIPLAKTVIEMALSPKSNSAIMAIDEALNDIRKGNTGNVPEHIKTTSPNYKYAHDYPNHIVKQQYLPNNLKGKRYYNPQNNKNELTLKEINNKIKEIID